MHDIRIAMVACRARLGETRQNLQNAKAWIHRAHSAGADIVCFPELSLTGYGNFTQVDSLAIDLQGAATEQISAAARKSGITVLAGFVEKNGKEKPFATHCVFGPDGDMAPYRKLHLAPPEQPYFSPGGTVHVFKHPKTAFGIQLCYDAHFPELSTAMALKGADIIFVPHASPHGDARMKHASWMRHLPARAFDNGLFVAACNQCGNNGVEGFSFAGNAMVLDPSGRILGKKTDGQEALLVADLRAADLDHVRKHRMRYFLPNRRPELYP